MATIMACALLATSTSSPLSSLSELSRNVVSAVTFTPSNWKLSVPRRCCRRYLPLRSGCSSLPCTSPLRISKHKIKIKMDPRTPPAAPRQYEIFEPKTDLVQEEAAITLLVYLPEFKKEQLRVQLSPSRVLRMSGERPLGDDDDDKWLRFVKETRVPDECDVKGIKVKFDKGVLYVKQSKFVAEKVENIEEPTKEIVDGNGKESGEAKQEECSLKNDGEEIINSPDELGGLLLRENIWINLRRLLLILVLAFGLVFRILYKGGC